MANAENQRVAWVVGGNRGIGAATVQALAEAGWITVASGRDGNGLEATGENQWSLPVDVRDDAAVKTAVDTIVGRLGRIDAIVASIRDSASSSFEALDDVGWNDALNTKLVGFIRLARHGLPLLKTSGGTLLTVVGSAATCASAAHPLGCVNAALRHVVRSLAMEWGRTGVRVLGVSPGPTETETLEQIIQRMAVASDSNADDLKAMMAESTYRRRFLEAGEVARIIVFLMGPEGAILNGTVLQADDGSLGGCL